MKNQIKVPIVIDKARYWALSNPAAAFYGSLASQLVDVMDPSVATAATDGTRILWNPDFVAGLTEEEVRFVLLHEALHCAHGHFWRLPLNEDGNVAGDYAINALLEKIPGLVMPKGGLRDRQFDGMAEEEILTAIGNRPKTHGQPPLIPNRNKQPGQQGQQGGQQGQQGQQPGQQGQQPGQQGQQPGQQPGQQGQQPGQQGRDPGNCGGFIAPSRQPGQSADDAKDAHRERWERAVVQAEIAAKASGRGDVPADMQRILDRVKVAAEVNWRDEMNDFAKSIVGTAKDYTRNSRKMSGAPVIYGRRKRDQIGTIVVVRDTSGSIDTQLCNEFSAQISTITADLNCSAVVIDCDTRIHAEYHLDAGEECPLEAKGGGGTEFDPAFDRVREMIDNGETIAGVIYLTDLDGKFPDEPADYPVLWAAYNTSRSAPFGRTIRVK